MLEVASRDDRSAGRRSTISVIVCAHNEARYLAACLHSLLAQTRPPDELLVINNASTDATRAVAQQIPNVRVADEPRKGLVVARKAGRRASRGSILVYVDADCRAPLTWLERIDRHFARDGDLIALSGPYRYYDWDWWGRLLNGKKNSHIVALDIKRDISADQPALDILREIRRQDGLSIACHPHHRTTRRIEISTCYLWDHRKELSDLVDVWEAANRDDLFSVTSLKHYPYVANSDFHKPKHLYSWKTLLRCEKSWPEVKRALKSNVDIALTLFRNGAWSG
jgi:glycosyltransferase involved in cell wall biosynthesis